MDEDMKELKSVLRSLVVSSPAQMDVRSLQRDYRTMMGSAIPVHKWGYKDVLSFLQERCADCFLIQGSSGNPVLTLIVPDTLKHIDQFVQRQKSSSITKMKGKRRSIPDTAMKWPEKPKYEKSLNMITETFNNKRVNSNQGFKPITNCQPLQTKSYSREVKPTVNNVPMSTNSNYREVRSIVKKDSQEVKPTVNNVQMSTGSNNREATPIVKKNSQEVKPTVNNVPISTNSNNREVRPITNNNTVRTNSNVTTNRSYSKVNTVTDNINSTRYKPEFTHIEPHRHQEQKVDVNKNNKENVLPRKRLSMYDSALELDSQHTQESKKVATKEPSDSGRLTASSGSSRRARLEELTEELLEMLRAHPHGILVTDLMLLYKEHFCRELALSQYGHHNLSSLLCTLDERVSFAEGADGVRLQDASAPPPPRHKPRPVVPTRAPTNKSDPNDALPGIEFDPEVFPDDCIHMLESIPGPDLAGVCPGHMLEVAVAEVYSPSHFWVQRLGAAHAGAMHALMDDMTEYYSRGAGRERVLARAAVRVGHYCAALFDGDWHRAVIVKVLDADTVKVRYVDYGTVSGSAARALKPLRREYAALRAQAVRARLAGLRPGAAARRWPHAAATHFLDLVRDRYFVANVVAVDLEDNVLETLLIDTSGEDDVCLSTELVRAGHADRCGDSALASGECYLLPRWEALEAADTPSYSEIHRYLADGIDLECVEAYRRHVPAAVPVPAPAPALTPALCALRLDSPPPAPAPVASLNVTAAAYIPPGIRMSPHMARPASPRVSPLAPAPTPAPASSLNVTAAPYIPPGIRVSPHTPRPPSPRMSPHTAHSVSPHTAWPPSPRMSPHTVHPASPRVSPHTAGPPSPRMSPHTAHPALPLVLPHSGALSPTPPQVRNTQHFTQVQCCPLCEWAVPLLEPDQKDVYDLFGSMDRIGGHCYIMTALYNNRLPVAKAPPGPYWPAAAGPNGPPVPPDFHSLPVPPGFHSPPVPPAIHNPPVPSGHYRPFIQHAPYMQSGQHGSYGHFAPNGSPASSRPATTK